MNKPSNLIIYTELQNCMCELYAYLDDRKYILMRIRGEFGCLETSIPYLKLGDDKFIQDKANEMIAERKTKTVNEILNRIQ